MLLVLPLSGCVTVYQPLVSLQRPVALDTSAPNFQGQHILVRCATSDYLGRADARRLCRKVQTLLTKQGATVDYEAAGRAAQTESTAPAARPDLIVELTARLVHSDNSVLLWILNWATATLVPALTEYTFAQDIKVLDADGFLLASDTLQARFVRYFGLAAWGFNALADLLVRSDAEELTGKAMIRDFTRDYYGHLSQLAFHAHMRSLVLHEFDERPAPSAPSKKPIAPMPSPTVWPASPTGAPPTGVPPTGAPPVGVPPMPAPAPSVAPGVRTP